LRAWDHGNDWAFTLEPEQARSDGVLAVLIVLEALSDEHCHWAATTMA